MTGSGDPWNAASSSYSLPCDEVHVWRAGLDWPPESTGKLYGFLSPDERRRADAFHFQADRMRHIVGRAISRILIGRCLGADPAAVRFAYGLSGKPRLAGEFDAGLNFNISHSGDYVLVALAYGRELGVDIEQIRTDIDTGDIAARFFSANECSSLAGLPANMRHDAFFACWTRKEAYIKARGDGLSLALNEFDVAFLPGDEPRLLETRHCPAEALRWTVRNLDAGANHKAALVAEGPAARLRCWEWLGDLPSAAG